MTEAEWPTATSCAEMIQVAARSGLDFRRRGRAFRRFAVYLLRDLTPYAPNALYALALDTAEQFLDGKVLRYQVERAVRAATEGYEEYRADAEDPAEMTARGLTNLLNDHPHAAAAAALGTVMTVSGAVTPPAGYEQWGEKRAAVSARYAPLLRELLGNPFRPVAFEARWRTDTALGLARGIYDERAFDRLPVLADAIQDAGCEVEAVLNHLRTEQSHVPGCWAVDLVLA